MSKRVIRALAEDAGASVAEVLQRRKIAPGREAELIARGSVYLNGIRDCAEATVEPGAKITVFVDPAVSLEQQPRVCQELAGVAVVEKPCGMPTERGRRADRRPLSDWIIESWGPTARAVHRLDQATSGLILVGIDARHVRELSELVRRREIERGYLAVVAPKPSKDSGTITAPLRQIQGRSIVDPKGRPAVTHYQISEATDRCALLEVRLETGRMHQIRVHLADLGCPIVGDSRYGGASGPRLGLHACRLALRHPSTKSEISVESPLPEAVRLLLSAGDADLRDR